MCAVDRKRSPGMRPGPPPAGHSKPCGDQVFEQRRRWLADANLLAGVSLRQLREDPAWLAVQVARQFPARWRRVVRPTAETRPGLLGTLRAVLADTPREAPRLATGHEYKMRWLGTQVGMEPKPGDRTAVARTAYVKGALSEAAGVGRGTRVGLRAASELRLLQPGFRLDATPQPPAPATTSRPERPLRVAMLLNNSLPHVQSGYAHRSQSMLTALRDRGVDAQVWTRLGWPASVGKLGTAQIDVVDGVPYHRLHAAHLPSLPKDRWQRQADRLTEELAEFDPDVIHATTDWTNGLVAQAVATNLGIPWVYEMRGQIELSWAAQRPSAWRDEARASERVRLAGAKEVELARAADAVLVLSQVQAEDLMERGLVPERLRVLPNGVDATLLSHSTPAAAAREALGLPTEGCWVGSVSSLNGYEGLDTLIQAVALARRQGVDVRCAIVGDGVSQPTLEGLGAQLGLGEHLVMPGRVSRAEAMRWYSALDVFAVPRRDTAACRTITPMKPLEAMAMGRPVVASDLPALRTIVDEDAGVLVPPSDVEALAEQLVLLAHDPTRRASLGRGARRAATSRTWAHNAEACDLLYQELLPLGPEQRR